MADKFTPGRDWVTGYRQADGSFVQSFAMSSSAGVAAPAGTSADPTFSAARGTPSGATGQVAIGTTATALVAARASRAAVTIINGTTTPVYIGFTSGVTTGTGALLPGAIGASITIETTAALFGITASSSAISFVETF